MNTRSAANDPALDKGPDEVTDPNITIVNGEITSEKSGEDVAQGAPFDEALPALVAPTPPKLPSSIQAAIEDAVSKVPAHLRGEMTVHRVKAGEISLHDVITFLKKEFPCFVLFTRMHDAQFKDAAGEWKDSADPQGDNPPKREFGVFLDGPQTAYDPKVRNVVRRWLDQTQVRDIGRRG